jgi:hypothetical protein
MRTWNHFDVAGRNLQDYAKDFPGAMVTVRRNKQLLYMVAQDSVSQLSTIGDLITY